MELGKTISLSLLVTIFIALFFHANAQITPIEKLEADAVNKFEARFDYYHSPERDSIFNLFDSTFIALSQHPKFRDAPLDSLSESCSIVTSENKKIRIFSWDNLGGGSYHDYTTYLEFNPGDGEYSFSLIEDEQQDFWEHTEVGFYKIETITEADKTYYLLFGSGTYGGGKKHATVQVYIEENGKLDKCHNCFPSGTELNNTCNRTQDHQISYDASAKSIRYKTFIPDEDSGFYSNDFKEKVLLFQDGKFMDVK